MACSSPTPSTTQSRSRRRGWRRRPPSKDARLPQRRDRCEQRRQRHEHGLQPTDEVDDFREQDGGFAQIPSIPPAAIPRAERPAPSGPCDIAISWTAMVNTPPISGPATANTRNAITTSCEPRQPSAGQQPSTANVAAGIEVAMQRRARIRASITSQQSRSCGSAMRGAQQRNVDDAPSAINRYDHGAIAEPNAATSTEASTTSAMRDRRPRPCPVTIGMHDPARSRPSRPTSPTADCAGCDRAESPRRTAASNRQDP